MNCPACRYKETNNGCETPGCMLSIHMTDEVRAMRKREADERQERERIYAIRARYA